MCSARGMTATSGKCTMRAESFVFGSPHSNRPVDVVALDSHELRPPKRGICTEQREGTPPVRELLHDGLQLPRLEDADAGTIRRRRRDPYGGVPADQLVVERTIQEHANELESFMRLPRRTLRRHIDEIANVLPRDLRHPAPPKRHCCVG